MHIIFTLFSVSLLHHFAGKTWPQSTHAFVLLAQLFSPEVISHTSSGKVEVSEHTNLPERCSLRVLVILYVFVAVAPRCVISSLWCEVITFCVLLCTALSS